MSYMFGMWAFSFILRFFDLQRILTSWQAWLLC